MIILNTLICNIQKRLKNGKTILLLSNRTKTEQEQNRTEKGQIWMIKGRMATLSSTNLRPRPLFLKKNFLN